MKIGLTLSGGGVRAAVFHLGVLARLAQQNQLEDVTFVSTVSGGSLCAGLVYTCNGFIWPTSSQLIDPVFRKARELLTTQDLQLGYLWRVLQSPLHLFNPKANYLSLLLQKCWGLTAKLSDIRAHPRWLINTTCYETGKDWRFESFRMGDYVFGYADVDKIPVSDAVAASAGFPGLVGALVLNTGGHNWFKYVDKTADTRERITPEYQMQRPTVPIQPRSAQVHLWDGGVYDNFGLEGLFDIQAGWRHAIDFLMVSDASGGSGWADYQPGVNALLRIISGVMMPQIRALRSRVFFERIRNHGDAGAFFGIGNSCAKVLDQIKPPEEVARLSALCLSPAEAARAAAVPTSIRRLSEAEFELLFRHGYEVANYTLYGYHGETYPFIAYADSYWGTPRP